MTWSKKAPATDSPGCGHGRKMDALLLADPTAAPSFCTPVTCPCVVWCASHRAVVRLDGIVVHAVVKAAGKKGTGQLRQRIPWVRDVQCMHVCVRHQAGSATRSACAHTWPV